MKHNIIFTFSEEQLELIACALSEYSIHLEKIEKVPTEIHGIPYTDTFIKERRKKVITMLEFLNELI